MTREIYLCSHPSDRAYTQKLRQGLAPVLSHFNLSLWHRDDTLPSTYWQDVLQSHLAHAAFFVALVSAPMLSDDDCYKEVLAAKYRAEHEDLRIVSIVLRPVAFFEFTPLGTFDYLPKDGKAITEQKNEDKAWVAVLRDLIEMIGASHRYLQERS